MSLRARLLTGLLALVSAGLLVSDGFTYASLRSFLTRRVDQQLAAAVLPVARELTPEVGPVGPVASRILIPPDTYGELRRRDGTSVARVSFGYRDEPVPPPKLPSALPGSGDDAAEPRTFTVGAVGRPSFRYRVLATPLAGGLGSLVVAVPLGEVTQTLRRLLFIEVVVTASVLAGLAALALWVVRLGLRPLDAIATTAGAIAAGDLARRVEQTDPRTEVGRLGLSLNAMLAQIEEAFAERTASQDRLRRFVADASHELRTPLTSIRGYAELFRRGAADRPEDLANSMRRIEEEADRMGGLVDDLLLLARLDQGRALEQAPVDLSRVAGDAVADARAVAPDRPITFDDRTPAVVVLGDEARLRQVAANLLSNAVTHTPEATPVHVRVRVTAVPGGDEAVLEVADEGPGLEPPDAQRVFERFYRGDSSRSRGRGGTAGLGLSIVSAIAEAHGGRATLATVAGQGALFAVHLPLAADQERAVPVGR